jgi:hypothetical protein
MMKLVRGVCAGLFMLAMSGAQAASIAWTTVETSMFVPSPGLIDRSYWTGNDLTLRYNSELVNGSLHGGSKSLASTELQFPSQLSALFPNDVAGFSFDFSHIGDFVSAGVSFEYYIPSSNTGVGRNTSYQANISTESPTMTWQPEVGGEGTQAPSLNLTNSGDVTHVEFIFSQEMLQHLDGLFGITFSSFGTHGAPSFSGSATYSDVSWLVSEGISDTYTRWHYTDPVLPISPVPEPATYTLLMAGLGLLGFTARRRKQQAVVAYLLGKSLYRFKAILSAVCAVICLLGVGSAQATLTTMDDTVFGTGAITLDTATGLEWLDLTKSTDLSYDFVSSQFGLGGQFYGFRYAINSEIGSLWTDAGILISHTTSDGHLFGDPANIAPIEALQALIGVTYSLTDYTTQGISGTIFAGTYPHELPYLIRSNGMTAPLCCEENIGGWVGSEHNPGVGSWLVRGVPPPPIIAIPEPATYTMLLAGLGLLGFTIHRRKLNQVRFIRISNETTLLFLAPSALFSLSRTCAHYAGEHDIELTPHFKTLQSQ